MRKRKLWVSILAGVLALILVLGLVVGVLPQANAAKSSAALAQQLAGLREDKEEIDKEIDRLEGELAGNLDDMEDIVKQKNVIDQQVFMMYEKIANLNSQIAAYGSLIADKQEELDAAEMHLLNLNAKNKERIRTMEENGNLSYWSVLFKANSFADLLDRLNMVEEIAAADQRRLQEMNEAARQVSEAKSALEVERAALEENKKMLEQAQEELEVKRDEADKLLAELVAKGEEYQKLLDEAEDESRDLASDIANTEHAYQQAVQEESKPSAGSGGSNPGRYPAGATDYVASDAKWTVPCKYTKMTSPYGWRVHPVHGDWRFHYGVDLAGPKGTPIKATRSGKVTTAQYSSSAGYYVKIDHGDGFSSVYMHMTHYIVKKGQQVDAGQVIGYMGSTGTSTGSHLHFGITYKGTYVNPKKYIKI